MKFSLKNKAITSINRGGLSWRATAGVFDSDMYYDPRNEQGNELKTDTRYITQLTEAQIDSAKAELLELVENMASTGEATKLEEKAKKAKE